MADARFDDLVQDDPDTGAEADEEVGERASSDPGTRDADAPDTGPGALLRAAREVRGLEQDELARALNLSPRVIRALEEDDDEQLPAATFVRGYIRSWARLVDEPVEPLLAAYEARAGRLRPMVQPTPYLEPASVAPAILHHRPGLVMTVATLVLAIAGATVLFGVWPDALAPGTTASGAVEDDRGFPERSLGEPGPSAGAGTNAENAEGAAVGSAAAKPVSPAAVPVEAGSSGQVAPEPAPVPAAAQGADAEVPVAADVVTEVSADGSTTRVLAGGEARLALAFSGDCWVEVRDGDDRVVHRDLHRAGQGLDLLGRAPFRVRLGYAPAVELSYNDSRVPLAPHTRNDVASLVIGR